ncbi:MAG: hypothetical protein AAFQ43_03250 [Bacteroidota bacterium]
MSRSPYSLWTLTRQRPLALLAGLAVVLTGCLPSSQKQNTRALTPADSAATAIAEAVPADSLVEVWTAPIGDRAFAPTGLAWVQPDSGAAARLAVIETRDGAIHLLSARGDSVGTWPLAEGSFPYLAGTLGDTVAVFARGVPEIQWVTAAGVVRRMETPEEASAALVESGRTVVRVGGGPSDASAALVRLSASGAETSRHPIAVDWRASGYVRAWGDSVLALSGYRPVADVLTPEASGGAVLDTLAFTGFDSPQLVRSYQFMIGEVDEPPLLTSGARALGDRLFVLNVRTERVRVDVYDRAGRLVRVLQGPIPTDPDGRPQVLDVYPADLAVREAASGAVEVAVLLQRPRGIIQQADARVVLFRWTPPADASPEVPATPEADA